jgi:hypothetical protein
LYQPDLPAAVPFLELFFACYRLGDVGMRFEPYQPVDRVLLRKTIGCAFAMRSNTAYQVGCDAGVQIPIIGLVHGASGKLTGVLMIRHAGRLDLK